MKMTSKVTSIECSVRLRDLGAPQTSAHMYHSEAQGDVPEDRIPAYTSEELGEILPHQVTTGETDGEFALCAYKHEDCWELAYERESKVLVVMIAPTEVEARAKMLAYLLEKKLINLN